MAKINGGIGCVYHGFIAAITFPIGPVSWLINHYSGNYQSVGECWRGTHN